MNFLPRLLVFFVLIHVGSSQMKWSRICRQCVSEDYVSMRWLMEHEGTVQLKEWVEDWKNIDCNEDKQRTTGCMSSCVTVRIRKMNETNPRGYMNGCADDLTKGSPDVPLGISFNTFEDDAIFAFDVKNHTITYLFSTIGFEVMKVRVTEEELVWDSDEVFPIYIYLLMTCFPLFCFCLFVNCDAFNRFFLEEENPIHVYEMLDMSNQIEAFAGKSHKEDSDGPWI